MASPQTLLQFLQTRTIVDCDTMDVEVAKKLGPFVDCTSNQAIAFFELSKPEHAENIQRMIKLSQSLVTQYHGVSTNELAVELSMVTLQLEMSRHITGFVHIQTNPLHSFDTDKMVSDARRIVRLFQHLDPDFDSTRVCIKIPSTWEGLQACRVLQSTGTTTLATTLFNIEQVVLAGEVGCHYIAPYVNELKVHFEEGFIDHNKAQTLCLQAQRYYEKHQIPTRVLPASLTSIDEVMELAGVHHITISPVLLTELAITKGSELKVDSLFDSVPSASGEEAKPMPPFKDDEAMFRLAFNLRGKGEGARKLVEAINIFCDMQVRLESMMV